LTGGGRCGGGFFTGAEDSSLGEELRAAGGDERGVRVADVPRFEAFEPAALVLEPVALVFFFRDSCFAGGGERLADEEEGDA